MSAGRFDVFGLGQCCLDYIGRVDGYPPADTKCEVDEMIIQGGGPVGTALVALTRWGYRCAIAGVIGDDRFGPVIRSSLDEEGIDTNGLLVRAGSHSQFAYIVAEYGTGARTIFWRRPTGPPPRGDEINGDRLTTARLFYTDGIFAEASLVAARLARQAGVPVVVDAGSLRDGMLELARTSDYFIASEKLARELVGDERPEEACRRIAELGPSVAGVTLGARGYIAVHAGRVIARPAYEARVVDTTGCGDVFHAGVACGVLSGWPVEKILDFAAWSAARAGTQLGGRSGIPPIGDYPARNG